MFSKTFVINLPFKTDRLSIFQKSVPQAIGDVEVWPAVHGDSIRHPEWWTAGAGAWGCYRSHLQILEHCYQQKVESYLVFEDDAIFRKDFEHEFTWFLSELPDDWEMVYLGGQLLHEVQHPPKRVNDHVFVPHNVNRTHAFAIHQRGYEKVYRHLNSAFATNEHVDHHLGRLHESGRLKVYCPGKWLVGQDGGPSNISGNTNAATFWVDPEKLGSDTRHDPKRAIPAIFLEAPIDVAVELERKGWHRGKWQNGDRLDRGVCDAITSLNVKQGLTNWYKAVMPEAVREGLSCVCLYHPTLSWTCVQSLECARFQRVTATAVEDAEHQLSQIMGDLKVSSAEPPKHNLIYHIWPRKGNGVWQWNVEQLLRRIELFDGIRSIGVVTDQSSDRLEDVQAAFGNVRIDNWICFPNDPAKSETVTFAKLLATIPADDSVTFRGHAKGVKYDDPHATREWAEMLYEICLDDPAFVDASLTQYPCCGPFVVESDWPRPGRWHFSGAFYWFRSSVLKNPTAIQVEENYWGAELWPQTVWERSDAGVLFGQTCGRLYNRHELERMKDWIKDWRAKKVRA